MSSDDREGTYPLQLQWWDGDGAATFRAKCFGTEDAGAYTVGHSIGSAPIGEGRRLTVAQVQAKPVPLPFLLGTGQMVSATESRAGGDLCSAILDATTALLRWWNGTLHGQPVALVWSTRYLYLSGTLKRALGGGTILAAAVRDTTPPVLLTLWMAGAPGSGGALYLERAEQGGRGRTQTTELATAAFSDAYSVRAFAFSPDASVLVAYEKWRAGDDGGLFSAAIPATLDEPVGVLARVAGGANTATSESSATSASSSRTVLYGWTWSGQTPAPLTAAVAGTTASSTGGTRKTRRERSAKSST
jgi:hypothetical protein